MTFLFSQIDGDYMSRFLLRLIAAMSWMAALTVSAQSSAQAPAAPPQARQAEGYRSAFEGYQPFTEEKILPWKQANDTVGQIGGWRAYAKEAHDAAAKADQAPPAGGAPRPAEAPAKSKGQP
jgi:hypothetical protein